MLSCLTWKRKPFCQNRYHKRTPFSHLPEKQFVVNVRVWCEVFPIRRKSNSAHCAPVSVQNLKQFTSSSFLANVNSRSCSLYAIACLSSVICLSSVTFVRTTQVVQIFGNISTALGTLAICWKFHGDRPRGTPPPGDLNTRGVAKYSDFRPIDGYSSKTVQDRR